MKKLFITHAEARQLYGKSTYNRPSRFLVEIPPELVDELRVKTKVTPAAIEDLAQAETPSLPDRLVGKRVSHRTFGEGTVIQQEGQGDRARLQIRFTKVGVKWLIASYVEAR